MQKSATVAVINNNKLLLLKRGSTAPWKSGKYCLPGGRLEKNESLKDCALRELFEETNILTYRDNLLPIVVVYDKGYSKTVFVTNIDHKNVTLNWEHDNYVWISAKERHSYDLVPGLNTTIKTLKKYGYLT